jgi:hypothetical protein
MEEEEEEEEETEKEEQEEEQEEQEEQEEREAAATAGRGHSRCGRRSNGSPPRASCAPTARTSPTQR